MERVRRETLNTKFQELAYALPTLRTVRRPSKSQIVQRALEFVRTAFVQEKIYQKQITNLKRENEILIAQLDTIRDKLTNRFNNEAFGIPAKIGDADFVLDDVHATQHAEDEDDQSTESWEYEAFGFGEGHCISCYRRIMICRALTHSFFYFFIFSPPCSKQLVSLRLNLHGSTWESVNTSAFNIIWYFWSYGVWYTRIQCTWVIAWKL